MRASMLRAHRPRLKELYAASTVDHEAIDRFVEGLPERYLRTRSASQVSAHARLAEELSQHPARTSLDVSDDICHLTVLAHDRPYLFADLAGALSSWGMTSSAQKRLRTCRVSLSILSASAIDIAP